MTDDELKKRITFNLQRMPATEESRMKATITFEDKIIFNHRHVPRDFVEDQLVERIARKIYEDKRRMLSAALLEFSTTQLWDSKHREVLERILQLAKRQ